jgi:hypothetical protein
MYIKPDKFFPVFKWSGIRMHGTSWNRPFEYQTSPVLGCSLFLHILSTNGLYPIIFMTLLTLDTKSVESQPITRHHLISWQLKDRQLDFFDNQMHANQKVTTRLGPVLQNQDKFTKLT